jgi:hypothetical protein
MATFRKQVLHSVRYGNIQEGRVTVRKPIYRRLGYIQWGEAMGYYVGCIHIHGGKVMFRSV